MVLEQKRENKPRSETPRDKTRYPLETGLKPLRNGTETGAESEQNEQKVAKRGETSLSGISQTPGYSPRERTKLCRMSTFPTLKLMKGGRTESASLSLSLLHSLGEMALRADGRTTTNSETGVGSGDDGNCLVTNSSFGNPPSKRG